MAKTDKADETRHDVFISYSQRDHRAAKAFQQGMENFGRPWYRPRELRVFRDTTNLSASPDLWKDIEGALARSEWLIVMASPEAAASPWVRDEIKWWIAQGRTDRMLIAWTRGSLEWDASRKTFDWSRTDALPETELADALAAAPRVPRWVDLRWLSAQLEEHDHVNANDPQLLLDVAEFVAPIRDVSKDALIGGHLRLRRRRNQTVAGAISVLSVLLILAIVLGLVAEQQRDTATERQLTATSRQLVAEAVSIRDTHPDLARQLLVQAYRLAPTAQVTGALIDSAATPRVIRTEGSPSGVAISPRGRVMAVAEDGGAALYDTASARRIVVLKGQNRSTALAFSHDAGLLAVGDIDGRLQLWNVARPARPELLATVAPTSEAVRTLAFAGKKPWLLMSSDGAQTTVVGVRDPVRPQVSQTLEPFALSGMSTGLATSPDGSVVAAGADDGKVRVMRLTGAGRLRLLKTLDSPSTALGFSPDGQLLAAGGSDYTTHLWDMGDPAAPRRHAVLNGQSLGIEAAAFTGEGDTLATGAGDGSIQLWDVHDPRRPQQGSHLTGHSSSIYGLAFAPDGRTLASASADGAARAPDGMDRLNGTVRLWNVNGAVRSSAYAAIPGGQVSPQAFDPKGDLLVAGRPTTVWNVAGAEPRSTATLETFNQGGQFVSFSPDGGTLATGIPLKLWDMTDPSRPREAAGTAPMTNGSTSVLFHPDGELVVSAGESVSDHLQLWKVKRHRATLLARLTASDSGPWAFAADRDLLAAVRADKKAVQLWDITNPSEPSKAGTFEPGTGTVTALAADPGGRTLLVGDSYGTVTTWDISDSGRVRRLGGAERHTGSISYLAFHPDGDLAASASDDGSVRLWDTSDRSNPRETAALLAEDRLTTSGIAFSPDGDRIAVAAADTTQLWDVRIPGILRRLCAESVPITRSQWTQYLPDRAYDPPCEGPAQQSPQKSAQAGSTS